jgi:hypothetical protein
MVFNTYLKQTERLEQSNFGHRPKLLRIAAIKTNPRNFFDYTVQNNAQ